VAHVELTPRAARDLEHFAPQDRDRISQGLIATLGADELPANADVKALSGAPPWLRLRLGMFCVLYRRMTREELTALQIEADDGYLVARIVRRRDLERAIATVPR
jgi:mRNA-degrading endonuclease RelE of RelBE toxin-antitoxin system